MGRRRRARRARQARSMTFNAPLDGGGVLISEKIKINLDLEFTKA